MRVRVSDEALRDLEEIGDWIASTSPSTARRFVRDLQASCRRIGLSPYGYVEVERKQYPGLRRSVHGAYLIYFRAGGRVVSVDRIVHGARDQERVLTAVE